MIIPGKLTSVSLRLTSVSFQTENKLNIPVFFRISPCFPAFSRLFPCPTRLAPVSICYSSCQIHAEADTMKSNKTRNQRYYLSYDRRRRDADLATTGGNLPDRAGECACVPAEARRGDQWPDLLTSAYRGRMDQPGARTRSNAAPAQPGNPQPRLLTSIYPGATAPSRARTRVSSAPARSGDQRPDKGDRTHLAYSPDPAVSPQSSPPRGKIARKAQLSYKIPSEFPHRSYISMLQCFPDLETPAAKGIHQTSPTGSARAPFLESFPVSYPAFLVRSWFVSDEAARQNATVASSSSARLAERDHPRLVTVSAHEKGGIAA